MYSKAHSATSHEFLNLQKRSWVKRADCCKLTQVGKLTFRGSHLSVCLYALRWFLSLRGVELKCCVTFATCLSRSSTQEAHRVTSSSETHSLSWYTCNVMKLRKHKWRTKGSHILMLLSVAFGVLHNSRDFHHCWPWQVLRGFLPRTSRRQKSNLNTADILQALRAFFWVVL